MFQRCKKEKEKKKEKENQNYIILQIISHLRYIIAWKSIFIAGNNFTPTSSLYISHRYIQFALEHDRFKL